MTCLRQLYEELEAGVLLNEIVTPDVDASICDAAGPPTGHDFH